MQLSNKILLMETLVSHYDPELEVNTNSQVCFVLFTKPKLSKVMLKFSYWIWESPRFSDSLYPSLAVGFRAGSEFVLALVFSPIGNRKTMLKQMKTDCNFLRSASIEK
jgi:hypothetical protein